MVGELTRPYLEAVDRELPGLVAGLYVVGSLALGAWQPGRSDVDAVILASRAPTAREVDALAEVHATLPGEPRLDCVYLSPDDGWPDDGRVAAFALDGRLHTDRACGNLNPVLWLTLRRYGIRVRGPAVRELDVPVDPEALRGYNLDNLRTYWQAQAAGIRRYLAGAAPGEAVDAGYATWVALGPARLHFTLATADVISKSGAGRYVIERFPGHASLAARAIRWRAGEDVAFETEDLRAAADLADLVADDAWRRWG